MGGINKIVIAGRSYWVWNWDAVVFSGMGGLEERMGLWLQRDNGLYHWQRKTGFDREDRGTR